MSAPPDPLEPSFGRIAELRRVVIGSLRGRLREVVASRRLELPARGRRVSSELAAVREELAALRLDLERLAVIGGAGDDAVVPNARENPGTPDGGRPDAGAAPPPGNGGLGGRSVRRAPRHQSLRRFDVAEYLRSTTGAEVRDARSETGVLWVIGGAELAPAMRDLRRSRGYVFTFRPEGASAAEQRPAWRAYLPTDE